ncbi:MAG: hypothetical protein OXI87_07195 [Albidovulum sp.]|nr:hypothetical protein [Albidovulum sp.]
MANDVPEKASQTTRNSVSSVVLTESTIAICAALEAGDKSWVLALGDPADASRFGLHKLPPRDMDGLPEKIEQVRHQDSASGVETRAMLTCEAGY